MPFGINPQHKQLWVRGDQTMAAKITAFSKMTTSLTAHFGGFALQNAAFRTSGKFVSSLTTSETTRKAPSPAAQPGRPDPGASRMRVRVPDPLPRGRERGDRRLFGGQRDRVRRCTPRSRAPQTQMGGINPRPHGAPRSGLGAKAQPSGPRTPHSPTSAKRREARPCPPTGSRRPETPPSAVQPSNSAVTVRAKGCPFKVPADSLPRRGHREREQARVVGHVIASREREVT